MLLHDGEVLTSFENHLIGKNIPYMGVVNLGGLMPYTPPGFRDLVGGMRLFNKSDKVFLVTLTVITYSFESAVT